LEDDQEDQQPNHDPNVSQEGAVLIVRHACTVTFRGGPGNKKPSQTGAR
jgi:hypothetical protein